MNPTQNRAPNLAPKTGQGPTPSSAQAAAPKAWHALDPQAVLRELGATEKGLSADDARERLGRYGANVLPRGKVDGPLTLLWRQIHNPLIWVLIASSGVALVADPTDGVKNGLVILAVVVLNTIIGFVQEFRAGKAIEALSQMVPENVNVLRDGQKVTLAASALVPGDVVTLASGDKVPADVRLIQARSLQIEEAALTGESVPSEKSVAAVAASAGLGDRTGMAFGGTLVTYGTGTAVVVETGARTELGKISAMLKETTDLQTPLTRALAEIGRWITLAIVVIAAVMLVVGTWRAMSQSGLALVPALRETIIFAIALAVGAIPEGLPAIVTIALAIGVQRMASRRAVIRKLPAVETLGSTTVICSDKTGTLTRNEMTVQALWTPAGGAVEVTGVGYAPTGQATRDGAPIAGPLPDDLVELLRAGLLCNDASVARGGQGDGAAWEITGDPTEAALVVAGHKLGLDPEPVRAQHPRLDAIPFESERQFMATLHRAPSGATALIMKGAPEVVLRRCAAGPGTALGDRTLAEVERLASQGMRVLAVARKEMPAGATDAQDSDADGGFTLLGLQGMIDPPRPEAIEAIRVCHGAGITVKMITGDHKATASAIGRQLNILGRDDMAVTGAQLAEMDDAQLREVVGARNVFARVAPEHKLRIVRALQARGEVVAMTGDGVNDAPALKQANIGVAMGITGTSVSKEAAAIVLTDDNFASIAAAVEEGRRVYDNLVKSLAFVLPTNLGLALILMVAVAFFPFVDARVAVHGAAANARELLLPMAPTQLLWINLVATVALALPLAFEAREPDGMRRPPRRPDAPVLSALVLVRTVLAATLMTAGCIGLFLYEFNAAGRVPEALAKAQTMAVTTVIMFQIFYMLQCRSLRDPILKIGLLSNPTVFVGVAGLVVLQCMFIYAPFMQAIFGSAALSAEDFGFSVLVGAVVLPVIGLKKRWERRSEARGQAG